MIPMMSLRIFINLPTARDRADNTNAKQDAVIRPWSQLVNAPTKDEARRIASNIAKLLGL